LTTRPRKALVWVGLGVSVGFGYLAVRDAHFADVWDALRDSDPIWLLPAFGALVVANLIRAYRWQILFRPATRPRYRNVLSAMLIGQLFNNVLPVRAGELARLVALRQSARTSKAEIAGTIVLERAYDVLCVLVLLFCLVPWLPEVSWLRAAAVLAIVLSAALVAGWVVLRRYGARPLRFVLRPLASLPFVTEQWVEAVAANLTHGLAGLRSLRLAAAALALTTASWVTLGISAWFVMESFSLGLSPVAGVLVFVAIGLGMILPSSPAAVGVFEAAVLIALDAYGIPDSQALSFALVLHALNFAPYVIAGLVALNLQTRSAAAPALRAEGHVPGKEGARAG
jgi:uncharacterized protein (TIRG00374 family)